MRRAMDVTLIIMSLYCCVFIAAGQVPPPENVRIISHDMGLILEWDPPQNSSERNFTYTAEFLGWQSFEPVCVKELSLSCDFTNHIAVFGSYEFRVHAELGGESSDWVMTESIQLDKKTIISAPEVILQSRNGEIEVDITDPVLKKNSLRDYYHISYRIRYWIEGQVEKQELVTQQSKPVLLDLTPKVRYCVQVEIVTVVDKHNLPSNETCILNTKNEDVKPWLIVVALVVSFAVVLVSVVLIFLAVWYSYRGIRFLHPQAKLPEHFKQYLSERPKSFLAMQHSPPPEEQYYEVSIIPFMEDPAASQDVQKMEGSNCAKLLEDVSSKQEEALSKEEKLCDHEQRKDRETAARDVGYPDGETEMLLQ